MPKASQAARHYPVVLGFAIISQVYDFRRVGQAPSSNVHIPPQLGGDGRAVQRGSDVRRRRQDRDFEPECRLCGPLKDVCILAGAVLLAQPEAHNSDVRQWNSQVVQPRCVRRFAQQIGGRRSPILPTRAAPRVVAGRLAAEAPGLGSVVQSAWGPARPPARRRLGGLGGRHWVRLLGGARHEEQLPRQRRGIRVRPAHAGACWPLLMSLGHAHQPNGGRRRLRHVVRLTGAPAHEGSACGIQQAEHQAGHRDR
mmetsp:Transcript_23774/g.71427  ORF Transcript_23774/g.71427 Transcript_23774/m.71427 type:complete len:254 (-) Transcript_23774:535-1296(-)